MVKLFPVVGHPGDSHSHSNLVKPVPELIPTYFHSRVPNISYLTPPSTRMLVQAQIGSFCMSAPIFMPLCLHTCGIYSLPKNVYIGKRKLT